MLVEVPVDEPPLELLALPLLVPLPLALPAAAVAPEVPEAEPEPFVEPESVALPAVADPVELVALVPEEELLNRLAEPSGVASEFLAFAYQLLPAPRSPTAFGVHPSSFSCGKYALKTSRVV